MSTKRVLIYSRFNRFWHWSQMLLIVLLAITGFEVHGTFHIVGFEKAVIYHNLLARAFMVLVAFAIFWDITTGQWKHYIPTSKNVSKMLRYYLVGIFKNEPHPVAKTELSKLNPLQRLVYLALKIIVIPVQIGTGLLYLYYNKWVELGWIKEGLSNIAFWHTLGAFAFLAFLVAHVYLITTGETIGSNLKAMITGWEEIHEEETQTT